MLATPMGHMSCDAVKYLILFRVQQYTCDADNGHVITVCAAVSSPAVMLATCDISLRPIAANVIQQNLSTAGTVAVTDKPPAVSVHKVFSHKGQSST